MNQLRTCSGKYDIATIFFNENISTWVDIIHTALTNQYEMPKIRICPGKYGFDSYVYVLSELLPNIKSEDIMRAIQGQLNYDKYIEVAHAAWIENYIFWKSTQEIIEPVNNPKKVINTIDRNNRATTLVKHLDSGDLEMYKDIITAVFDVLTKKILEAGMQNLSIA